MKYSVDLEVGGEEADGVGVPEPGQLVLDVADGGLQVAVQRH